MNDITKFYDLKDLVFSFANVSAIVLFITGIYLALRFSRSDLGFYLLLIAVVLGCYDLYNQLISSVPQTPNVKYDLSKSDYTIVMIIVFALAMTVTGVIFHNADKHMSENLTQGEASRRLLLDDRKKRRFTKRRNLNALQYDDLVNTLKQISDENSDFRETEQRMAKELIKSIYQIKRDCVKDGNSFTLNDVYHNRLNV